MLTALVDALGWTLLDTLWQVALIVLVYGLLRASLQAARARVFVGHLALLSLAIVPLLDFARHWIDATRVEGGSTIAVAASRWTREAIEALPVADRIDWLAWLVVAWAVGVAWSSLGLLREWWMLRRLCREALPLDAAWQRRFATLRDRLQVTRRVGLAMSARVAAPLLVGVVRPVVLLPASLFARLPAEQVELILLHELAHLRRLDPWFNLLQAALDTLMFYHPAMRWLSRRLRHDRELCCDDLVVAHGGDRLRYARTLLTLAEHAHGMPHSVALAASGGVLLERVERIVEVAPRRRAYHGVWPVSLLLLAGLIASPVAIQRFVSDAATTLVPLAIGALPIRAEFAPPGARIDVANVAGTLALPRPRWTEPMPPEIVAPAPAPAPSPDAFVAHAASPDPAPVASPPVDAAATAATPAALAPSVSAPIAAMLAPVDVAEVVAAAPAPAKPLRTEVPSYPRGALADGTEGWVRLGYGVDADGRTTDIEVIESQPAGIFDTVSVRALQRWRFPAEAAGVRRQHQFDFVLQGPSGDEAGVDRCPRRTGSRLCAPPAPAAGSQLSGD